MVTDRTHIVNNEYYYEKQKEALEASSSNTNPGYYKRWKVEPITFCMENDLPFWLGSVIKYIMRYDQKNGIEDLRKAKKYIDFKIKELENANGR